MQESSPRFSTKLHTFFIVAIFAITSITTFTGCSGSEATTLTSGLATGTSSPEIITQDANNRWLQLSALKGTYVLVEFWESGNADARRNHIEMERLYKKYQHEDFKNGKNYSVYSVSLDTDKNKWLAAVTADNVSWNCQTIDTKSWNAQAALDFGINYLPKYYLLDGDGVVIKKNILIGELESILNEHLH